MKNCYNLKMDVLFTVGSSAFVLSGGDPKAALVAAASAGVVGPRLSKITRTHHAAVAITAHGVWGGISSEILGGGFVEGFAGNAVGKAITLGSRGFFGVPDGDFHSGHFASTVVGGALAAELAGGDGSMGAVLAGIGYTTNWTYAGQKIGHDAVRSPMDRPPQNQHSSFYASNGDVWREFAGAKEVAQCGAAAACFTSLVVCTQGSRIPGAMINPATPYPYACALSTACTVEETAYRGLKGRL